MKISEKRIRDMVGAVIEPVRGMSYMRKALAVCIIKVEKLLNYIYKF